MMRARTATPNCLIGLTGRPSAGKDSAGALLACAGWRKIAFADALRIEAASAWDVPIEVFADPRGKEQPNPHLRAGFCQNADFLRMAVFVGHSLQEPRSPRWVMQQWGSWRRQAAPMYWITPVEQWVQYQRGNGYGQLVITDVRHENEALMVGWLGGHLVRMHRPGLPALTADAAAHESEQHAALPSAAEIHNDGNFAHLEAEVWRVVHSLAPATPERMTP